MIAKAGQVFMISKMGFNSRCGFTCAAMVWASTVWLNKMFISHLNLLNFYSRHWPPSKIYTVTKKIIEVQWRTHLPYISRSATIRKQYLEALQIISPLPSRGRRITRPKKQGPSRGVKGARENLEN